MRWCRRIGAAFGGLAVAGLMLAATTGMTFAKTAATATTASNAVAYQIDPRHDGNQRNGILNVSRLTRKWSVKLGRSGCCDAEAGDVSYPIIAGGRVFVTVENASSYGGRLYALSARSGATLWSVGLPGTYGFSALAYDRGHLFGLNYDGVLTAFAARTGHELWASQMPGQWAFTAPPTAYNGVVYVSGAGDGGTVYAVSETSGAVKWTARVMNGDASSPAVDSTGVYVSYDGQQDYRFSLGGRLLWHHRTCCEGGGGSTAVLHGSGTVFGLSASSGQRMWTGKAGSVIYGPDEQNADVVIGMAAGDGLLVVPAGRVLTAFGG
jgi:outer membrane protein assembly factor BamB